MANQTTINFVQDPRSAQALLNPLRIQLLQKLRTPGSASTLAREFNLSRQKLNYHLRKLEKQGLIEQVEERRKGNCVERIVRATAKSYIIDPEALGTLATDPAKVKDKFSSSYLIAVATQMIRELAVLRTLADKAKKRFATFTLQTEVRFESAEELNQFTEELSNSVADLAAKYHNEQAKDGRVFKFVIGSYPTITKKDESQ